MQGKLCYCSGSTEPHIPVSPTALRSRKARQKEDEVSGQNRQDKPHSGLPSFPPCLCSVESALAHSCGTQNSVEHKGKQVNLAFTLELIHGTGQQPNQTQKARVQRDSTDRHPLSWHPDMLQDKLWPKNLDRCRTPGALGPHRGRAMQG